MIVRASIIGGSGYAGGELLRILLDHPNAAVHQITSERLSGKRIARQHPHLRGRTDLLFSTAYDLDPVDVLFLALPHTIAMTRVSEFASLAPILIDLSSDFRLNDPVEYRTFYGQPHFCEEKLSEFVYGIPELHRDQIRTADRISSAGCLATASILSMWPLFRDNLLDLTLPVVTEATTGSSAAGAEAGIASHHPERSGVIRPFKPTGHRHTAELRQELDPSGKVTFSFSATSVQAVRGVLATSHVFTRERLDDKAIWNSYRRAYRNEPFVRVVKDASGLHRYPEPKILSGSNYCDVGFEVDPHSHRVVVMGALDNLVKGAAGQAIQAMNIRFGFDEAAGLNFPGLHPI